MLLHDLVETSRRVAGTSGRLAKIDLVAGLLNRASPDEIETVIGFLSGAPRQGRIGVGYATLQATASSSVADPGAATLSLSDVDATLDRLAATTGKGSGEAKERLLRELFDRATPEERDFLVRMTIGELTGPGIPQRPGGYAPPTPRHRDRHRVADEWPR